MPRKPRPQPFSEGDIAYIWKHFIAPLLQYKGEEQDMKAFLEETVFDIKHREIIQYQARENFELPGLYCLAPYRLIQGLGYRHVPKGTYLHVRFDARNEARIDVEFQGGVGNADQWFALDKFQWYAIAPLLDEVLDRSERPKPPKPEPKKKKKKKRQWTRRKARPGVAHA